MIYQLNIFTEKVKKNYREKLPRKIIEKNYRKTIEIYREFSPKKSQEEYETTDDIPTEHIHRERNHTKGIL